MSGHVHTCFLCGAEVECHRRGCTEPPGIDCGQCDDPEPVGMDLTAEVDVDEWIGG